MPVGTIALLILLGLMFFGLFHTTLDRLKLSDTQAISAIVLIILGSFISIPLTRNLSINVGGTIPVLLAVYVLARADRSVELLRGLLAIIITTGGIYLISRFLSQVPEPGTDSLYLNGLLAGVIAYAVGRSRRTAFSAGVLSVFILDIIHLISRNLKGQPVSGTIAGAGAFDSLVIAGIVGLLLAEILGETIERVSNIGKAEPTVQETGTDTTDSSTTLEENGGDHNE
jgi:uncharacterized membrane protein